MKWLYVGVGIFGAAAAMLGGLWFLQGTGVVVIEPIACVGECTALIGPNSGWASARAALMLVGIGIVWWSMRRFRRS